MFTSSNILTCIYLFEPTFQDDLKNIIYHRLPVLLNRGPIKLVVIDSIAALFRVEYSFGETSKRAKVLRSFGAQLHKLSHQCGIPVVCVNQVCLCYMSQYGSPVVCIHQVCLSCMFQYGIPVVCVNQVCLSCMFQYGIPVVCVNQVCLSYMFQYGMTVVCVHQVCLSCMFQYQW